MQGDEWNRVKSAAGIQRARLELQAAQLVFFTDLHEPTGERVGTIVKWFEQ